MAQDPASLSAWEGMVRVLSINPMVFVRETNWNVAQWIDEGSVFLDGEMPYKVTDWKSSEGLYVEDSSAPLYLNGRGGDIILCLFVGLVMFAARMLLNQLVLFPLARSFGILRYRKQLKFAEAGAMFLYYLPIFAWGARLLVLHEFALPLQNLFTHYPQRLHTFELKLYLTVQVGFYISAMLFLRYIDVRRKDFVQMSLHHALTLALIYLAEHYNFRNFTVIVLALHDFSDILLYLSKTLLYMGLQSLVQFTFAAFALSFFASRIVLFPRVIWTWHYEVIDAIGPDDRWDLENEYYCDYWARYRVTFLMCALAAMQLFWFYSIMVMVVDSVTGNSIRKDIRSDSDDEASSSSSNGTRPKTQ